MTDTTQAAGNGDKDGRVKIADRDWLDAQGEVTNKPEEAHAVRYTTLLGAQPGAAYTHSLTNPGTRAAMLEGFGALTLMGNVVNTWKTLSGPEQAANPIEDVEARFALLETGQWIERGEGGVGARIDKAVLARVYVDFMAEQNPPVVKEFDVVLAKLEEDKTLARKMRSNDEIRDRYDAAVGRVAKVTTTDQLANLI